MLQSSLAYEYLARFFHKQTTRGMGNSGLLRGERHRSGRAASETNNQKQTGDPSKLSAMLVRLAAEEKPPLRYLAGSDALQLVTGKLEA